MKYPVLLPNIFDYPFTYESNIKLKAGDYVKVPFGKKNIIGVIWDFFEEKNKKEFKLKSITEKIEIEPLSKNTMNFLKWFSNYNLVPLGMCLKLHLINDDNLKIKNDSDLLKYALSSEKESYQLSEEQDKAYKELSKNDSSFRVHLLQGTTGSGKTIVYFKAIEKIINTGLQLGVDYGMTSTCYDPDIGGEPCGKCDACFLRLKGFDQAGAIDPLNYPIN